MLVGDGAQRGGEPRLAERGRHRDHQGLAERLDGAAASAQPVHDRGERDLAPGLAVGGTAVLAGSPVVGLAGDGGQRRDRPVLEDLRRGEQQSGPAGPADQLDGHDAVAAEVEEAVVGAGPLHAEDPAEQAGQQFLAG